MAVVCRVRITGIFYSPAAAAHHIPLPCDEHEKLDKTGRLQMDGVDGISGPEYILKLYDRRCFVNVRQEFAEGRPYSMRSAKAYQKYLEGAPAPHFTRSFFEMPGLREVGEEDDEWVDEEEWGENELGLFEAWLENDAVRTFQKELSMYMALVELQGHSIPKLFDTVTTSTPFIFADTAAASPNTESISSDGSSTGDFSRKESPVEGTEHDNGSPRVLFVDPHRVQGILIEYIPGPSLRSFLHAILRCPNQQLRKELASVADEAVALVLRIGSYPVLNRDVRLDNMLVRESYSSTLRLEGDDAARSTGTVASTAPGTTLPRCVAIDFGHSRLRFPDETDEQWRCAKNFYDEERLMAIALRYEIRGVLQKMREQELELSDSVDAETAKKSLPDTCREEQEAIWNYQQRAWYRALSPEEQKESEANASWGQHPNARD